MPIDDPPEDAVEAEGEGKGKKKGKLPKLSMPSPDWLLPAVVTGGFALVGVLAGGAITYKVQSKQSSDQQDAAAAQSLKVAQGTARLMDVEFKARAAVIAGALKRTSYPRSHVSLTTKIPIEDQRALAAEMSAKDWSIVAAGEAKIGDAQLLLNKHPRTRLTGHEPGSARHLRTTFRQASAALEHFAR